MTRVIFHSPSLFCRRRMNFASPAGSFSIRFDRLWPIRRKYAEPASSLNSVSIEVRMVHRQNCRLRFSFRQIHQRGIGEIHRPVPVVRHQRLDVRQFRVVYCGQEKRSRTDEPPGCLHFPASIADKVKQFGQNSLGRYQGEPELTECVNAGLVLPVPSVQ